MNDDVPVAMRRAPIVDMYAILRQPELELVCESFGRRQDHQRGRAPNALREPPAFAFRHQLLKIAPEEHADLGQGVGTARACRAQRPELALERLQRLLMRNDGHVGECDVAGDVIKMEMRVDDRAHWQRECLRQSVAEFLAERAILLCINNDQAERRFDRACIGIASSADPCMHAFSDVFELRIAHLSFQRASRSSVYHEGFSG